jgi:hypothetical protein
MGAKPRLTKRRREEIDDAIRAEFEEDKGRYRAAATMRHLAIERAAHEREMDTRFINRRAAAVIGRDQAFLEGLDDVLGKVFASGWIGKRVRTYKERRSGTRVQRILNVILSDLHFQSLFDPEEVPVPYGAVEESRRLGKVAANVAEYKRDHRAETKLIIHLIGDIIENLLHDMREGATLTIQIAAAIDYIVQLVMFLASQFPEVLVMCTPGNHGRNTTRHRERAVAQKWDSLETIIYLSVKKAIEAAGLKNVKFDIGRKPYYVADLFGAKAFFTHGDTVLKVGYPGNKIDVSGLYHQICKWNSARNIDGPFKLFAVGHVHFGSLTNMPGEVVMITNGCLVPPGPHALSIGSPDVSCGQWMFESTPSHPVGDSRFINVAGAEKNPEYNSIIKPFSGF